MVLCRFIHDQQNAGSDESSTDRQAIPCYALHPSPQDPKPLTLIPKAPNRSLDLRTLNYSYNYRPHRRLKQKDYKVIDIPSKSSSCAP